MAGVSVANQQVALPMVYLPTAVPTAETSTAKLGIEYHAPITDSMYLSKDLSRHVYLARRIDGCSEIE